MPSNKRKIINDPVYGFISIPDDFIFDLIEHPFFQRLRRIQQLGLTHLVYPGALHTRFHHSIGAMHLMQQAIEMLKSKGTKITEEETSDALCAILLHDIGHGPFSHALENSIIEGIHHEEISLAILQYLNAEKNNKLENAINIFLGHISKKFLHQLVSSQLDVDRLDYLTRDSFFTGVSEGIIGTERIIKMMNVHDNQLVIDEKGIFSIEKFLVSRQLMYWQVYLHKTVISAEILLIKILKRAKYLAKKGYNIFTTKHLELFLKNNISKQEFLNNTHYIESFCKLDDYDILYCIKEWSEASDKILSTLCKMLINRRLFKTIILEKPITIEQKNKILQIIEKYYSITPKETHYFFENNVLKTFFYDKHENPILILKKNNYVSDITKEKTIINLKQLSSTKIRHYLTFPKEISNEIVKIVKF